MRENSREQGEGRDEEKEEREGKEVGKKNEGK